MLTLLVSIALMDGIFSHARGAGDERLSNIPERNEAFMDWGLGMFIHWGVDVQLGSVISHSMVGASDEYLERYIRELPRSFDPGDFDPGRWAKMARLAGFEYMVFTTKHHSGFCMWPTETTDFSVKNTPFQRDVVGEYVKACRENGLKVGFYFSPDDFHFLHRQGKVIRRLADYAMITGNPDLLEFNSRQVKELFDNYGPVDVMFFDSFENDALVQLVHRLQPDCIVTRGEMETPEQNIPDAPVPGPWEACFTLGNQWQFKPSNEEYKSGTELINMLIEIRAKGGNLLINMGPDPEGRIPFEQERVFRELSLWMFVNREAIHGIRPCEKIRERDIWFTKSKDGRDVYMFLRGLERWDLGERRYFTVRSVEATEKTSISVLGQNDKVVEYRPEISPASGFTQKEGELTFSVYRAQRLYNNRLWPNPVVVKMTNVRFINR
jgi:alpha-L-fucosidase